MACIVEDVTVFKDEYQHFMQPNSNGEVSYDGEKYVI